MAGALVANELDLVLTSNRGENTVGIFSPHDEAHIARVAVGVRPNGLSCDPARGLLLAANVGDPAVPGSYTVSLVDVNRRALLRDIPGIAETLLVGEGRPYCVALLWIIDPDDAPSEAAISRAMADLSRGLSHPEQVKRWAVLRNDLSIERGDLTANLKLKRQAVGVRLQGLIEALYDGSPAGADLSKAEPGSLCEGFLFAGEAARD